MAAAPSAVSAPAAVASVPRPDTGSGAITQSARPQGGYQVRLLYRITTPEASFDLAVPLHGSKSQSKEQPGRQWQVGSRGS